MVSAEASVMSIQFNALYTLVVLGQAHIPWPAGCSLASTAWHVVGLRHCDVGGLCVMFSKLGQRQWERRSSVAWQVTPELPLVGFCLCSCSQVLVEMYWLGMEQRPHRLLWHRAGTVRSRGSMPQQVGPLLPASAELETSLAQENYLQKQTEAHKIHYISLPHLLFTAGVEAKQWALVSSSYF